VARAMMMATTIPPAIIARGLAAPTLIKDPPPGAPEPRLTSPLARRFAGGGSGGSDRFAVKSRQWDDVE
jgi:hypothetical protein